MYATRCSREMWQSQILLNPYTKSIHLGFSHASEKKNPFNFPIVSFLLEVLWGQWKSSPASPSRPARAHTLTHARTAHLPFLLHHTTNCHLGTKCTITQTVPACMWLDSDGMRWMLCVRVHVYKQTNAEACAMVFGAHSAHCLLVQFVQKEQKHNVTSFIKSHSLSLSPSPSLRAQLHRFTMSISNQSNGGNGGDKREIQDAGLQDLDVPTPIQTFLWSQTAPFVRPRLGKLHEAACQVSIRTILIHFSSSNLNVSNLMSNLNHLIVSIENDLQFCQHAPGHHVSYSVNIESIERDSWILLLFSVLRRSWKRPANRSKKFSSKIYTSV